MTNDENADSYIQYIYSLWLSKGRMGVTASLESKHRHRETYLNDLRVQNLSKVHA